MKKFFAVTMAAACALTFAAFGLSACDEGETVTEEEWMAAFDAGNLCNVTIDVSFYEESTYEDYSSKEEEDIVVELDLADNSAYLSGNISMSSSYSYSYSGSEGHSYDKSTMNVYEVLTADSYSYVWRDAYSGYTVSDGSYSYTDWRGDMQDAISEMEDTFWYYWCEIDEVVYLLANTYSMFTYDGGVYKLEYAEDGASEIITVEFTDGKLDSIVAAYTDEWNYTENSLYFYNYGSTTVSVPTEYTYAYYLENYAEKTDG